MNYELEWQETTLGEVCELKRGYDLPASARRRGSVPIVSSSGITGYHSDAKVAGPGVVTGRYGTLGQVFFVDTDFWPLNTALYVRNFKGNDPRYVAALLEYLELGQNDGAAAVPGLNRNQLHMLAVHRPTLATQRAISWVLRSIENLAENCLRRIELLELMAQSIYREWFLHFRYPGHEGVPLVDSALGPTPKGWERAISGDLQKRCVLEIGDGYRAKNSELSRDGGLPFIRVANVRDGHLALEDADELPLDYIERLRSKVSSVGDVVISMKGTVGRTAVVEEWHRTMAYSPQVSFWRSLAPEIISPTYLYQWVRSDDFARQCSAAKGATDMADYVNLTDQRRMSLVVPPPEVMADFVLTCAPLRRLIGRLQARTSSLFAVRELLLPRLVTGQIDVSHLDLDALVKKTTAP